MTENQPPGKGRGFQKIPSSQSVRKNLFGRDENLVDEDLAKEVDELQKRESKRFQERWNFDPDTDTRLSGQYEWSNPVPLNFPTPLLHVPHDEGSAPTDLDSVSSNLPGSSCSDTSNPASSPLSTCSAESTSTAGLKRNRSSVEGMFMPFSNVGIVHAKIKIPFLTLLLCIYASFLYFNRYMLIALLHYFFFEQRYFVFNRGR